MSLLPRISTLVECRQDPMQRRSGGGQLIAAVIPKYACVQLPDGVVWSVSTGWPADLADLIREASHELADGTFRVGEGGDGFHRTSLIMN